RVFHPSLLLFPYTTLFRKAEGLGAAFLWGEFSATGAEDCMNRLHSISQSVGSDPTAVPVTAHRRSSLLLVLIRSEGGHVVTSAGPLARTVSDGPRSGPMGQVASRHATLPSRL